MSLWPQRGRVGKGAELVKGHVRSNVGPMWSNVVKSSLWFSVFSVAARPVLSWFAVDQFATTGAPSRSPPSLAAQRHLLFCSTAGLGSLSSCAVTPACPVVPVRRDAAAAAIDQITCMQNQVAADSPVRVQRLCCIEWHHWHRSIQHSPVRVQRLCCIERCQ